MRSIVLFISLTLCFSSVLAQEVGSETYQQGDQRVLVDTVNANESDSTGHTLIAAQELKTTQAYGAQPLHTRKFDKTKWKEIVGGERFEEVPRSSLNLSMPWAAALLKLLAYPVLIAAVVVLLYLVVKNISFDVRIKRDELNSVDIEKPLENIEEFDVDALLDEAKREGNFKVAVRLYYLALLKKLHTLEKISWKKDKTNRDYLSELLSKDFYFQEMRKLTLAYESVWYGDHEVDADSFQRLSSEFELVFQQLNRTGTL